MSDRVATQVTTEFHINPALGRSVEEFHERALTLTDQLMEQEEADELVSDTTVSSDAGEYIITVEFLVFLPNMIEASAHALTFLRAALHALGASTPGWPDYQQIAEALETSKIQTERTLVPA